MKPHPDYLAKFSPDRQGAIHDQYCVTYYTFDLYCEGRILHTSEPVFKFVGAWFWHRRVEFMALCRGARNPAHRALADVVEGWSP